ncbi:hypothetical protein ACGC1H_002102 [Rhizoctonia solani]
MDEAGVELVDRMLTLNPASRITAFEALDHDLFWVEPLCCDPASLPKCVSSHEYKRKHKVEGPPMINGPGFGPNFNDPPNGFGPGPGPNGFGPEGPNGFGPGSNVFGPPDLDLVAELAGQEDPGSALIMVDEDSGAAVVGGTVEEGVAEDEVVLVGGGGAGRARGYGRGGHGRHGGYDRGPPLPPGNFNGPPQDPNGSSNFSGYSRNEGDGGGGTGLPPPLGMHSREHRQMRERHVNMRNNNGGPGGGGEVVVER